MCSLSVSVCTDFAYVIFFVRCANEFATIHCVFSIQYETFYGNYFCMFSSSVDSQNKCAVFIEFREILREKKRNKISNFVTFDFLYTFVRLRADVNTNA